MFSSLGNIGLASIKKITDLWSAGTSDSLIDYTAPSRVEPIVLIDSDALYHEALPQVQQSLLSQFAGYYLQAIAISTTVGKIDVSRHLDKLNPNRSPINSAINSMGYLLAAESYHHKLPTYAGLAAEAMSRDEIASAQLQLNKDKFEYDKTKASTEAQAKINELNRKYADDTARFGTEQANKNAQLFINNAGLIMDKAKFDHDVEKFGFDKAMKEAQFALDKKRYDDTHSASEISIGKDTLTVIRELSDLSVGKLFSVEITDGLHKASIPISIRLMASQLPSDNLVKILGINNEDTSVKERYYAWKSGQIEFIKDLVLCQDLIDSHRKNLMNDKDGIYTSILARRRGNQISTLVSANPSVATASNIAIITNDTVDKLQAKINGKLEDFKTREKIFKETYLMIIAVIDKKWNRVTFYHRGISSHTELGMQDLKASNRGSGPDVSEILKAYSVGHAPSL